MRIGPRRMRRQNRRPPPCWGRMQKPRAREQRQKRRGPRGLAVRIARRAKRRDVRPVCTQTWHQIGRWSPPQEALSPVSPSLRPVPQDEECRTMTPAPIHRTDAEDEGSGVCFARIADMNFLTGRAFARGAAPKPQPRPRPHAHPPRPSKKPLPSRPRLRNRRHPPDRRRPPRSRRPCAPRPRPRQPLRLPSRRPRPRRTSRAEGAAARHRSSRPRRLSPWSSCARRRSARDS